MLTVPRFLMVGMMAVGLALSLALPVPSEISARQNASYVLVTDQRLRDPEPDNWLMYRRTYNGLGYSPLRQIRSQNVVDLKPAWVFSTGVYDEHHQAPPIVNEGTMFVTTGAQVIALDATDGDLLWRYVRELPQDLRRPHPTNRDVWLYDDRVYVGTLDAIRGEPGFDAIVGQATARIHTAREAFRQADGDRVLGLVGAASATDARKR